MQLTRRCIGLCINPVLWTIYTLSKNEMTENLCVYIPSLIQIHSKFVKAVKLLASIRHIPGSNLGWGTICTDWVVFHSPSQAKCWFNTLLSPLLLLSASFSTHCLSFVPFDAVVWDANSVHIQSVPGGKVNILGGHSIGHSKQKKIVYVHVSYSERLPR
jgi:hypothetical protein